MKKKIVFIGVILIIIAYIIFSAVSYAESKSMYVGLNTTHSNGQGYGIGNPKSGGIGIWNLRNYNSTSRNDESSNQKELYCLKGAYGDTWENNSSEILQYNLTYDLDNEREKLLQLLKENNSTANNIVTNIINDGSSGIYKELLWIIDNAYIPGKSDKNQLLKKLGINYDSSEEMYYYEPGNEYDYSSKVYSREWTTSLTETDIKAVQQAVIWYFTNAKLDNETKFDKTNSADWLTLTVNDGNSYTQLVDYNKNTGEGIARYDQSNILYNYLIDSAIKNADKYDSGKYQKPIEVNLTGLTTNTAGRYQIQTTRNGENYITGPIKIIKNNDLGYNMTLKITNAETGSEIESSNYTFVDANGKKLGVTDPTQLVEIENGFYISIPGTIAKSINIDITTSYTSKTKSIWLSGTENGSTSITLKSEQPVLEFEEYQNSDTIKLSATPKDFDLALRKYITKVNDEEVKDTRIPDIDLTNLKNGTTATYKHRKDPVIVENGNTVTYKITIYNEGDKKGFAKEITDQLPTGLEYSGPSSITTGKNTYDVSYNSTTNQVIFSAKTTNALNIFQMNLLDSETLEFTCNVTATSDLKEDKILTNVAWISREYDTDSDIEITNIGEDRDSRPQKYPNVNKDNMENYKGNSNNKTDLTDSSYYYEGEQDDDDFEKLVLEPQTSITVNKTWADNNDQDGLRKNITAVKVNLLADNEVIQTVDLKESNSWSYTFNGLPLKKNGKIITYSVSEVSNIGGYDTTVNGFVITNTHIPEKTNISVEKKWQDNNNQDGLRANEVIIQLLADDVAVNGKTITLNASNNWKASFENLPKKSNGKEVKYTVKEVTTLNGYDSKITGNMTEGYIITNTHNPNVIEIPVEKVWNDSDDLDKIRPAEIKVKLLANGSVVEGKNIILNEENEWKASFTNLPEKNNGSKIEYTVEEENVPSGYTKNITGNMTKGFVITNSHTPEKISIPIKKVWDDNDNQDGKRPANITIILKANGEEVEGKTIQLKGTGNEWTYTFSDLPKYENGNEIKYSIEETGIPQGYESSQSGDMTNGFIITNKHLPEKINIPVKKVWKDNDNQDGVRPNEIEIILKANGIEKQRQKIKGTGNEWKYIFSNLPKYENGKEITYTIEENSTTTGYTSLISGNSTTGFIITNTYTPGIISVKVTKIWNDNNNQDGLRPTSISVSLIANGDKTNPVKTVDLSSENSWTYIFTDLPEKSNGENINYTIVENTKIDGYTTQITNNNISSMAGNIVTASAPEYTVINTHNTEEISINVNKVWNDQNDLDKIRPTSVVVNVKNGDKIVATATLNAENEWKYTFNNLQAKQNGEKIIYEIEEVVPDGYKVNITEDGANNYTITNTHLPEKTFDLALRKYITQINNNDLVSLGLQSRIPNISEITLKKETTATYKHRKDPIQVEEGDIVTYKITIYNEGDKAGYASQIIDQLPTGLIYNPSSTIISKDSNGLDKNTYSVRYESSTNKVIFDIVNTAQNIAKELQPYSTGNLDSETIELKCKVIYKAIAGEKNILTNVAWINEAYNTTDDKKIEKNGDDRDSEPSTKPNVNKDNMEEYKGNASNKDDLSDSSNYYKGEQDDDDFEKLYVKTFDLSLRKFITSVAGTELKDSNGKYIREPIVDVTGLKNKISTTAIYKHSKEPIALKAGDNVIYTIRVYNEGEIAGYANQIKDYLPKYLIYVKDSSINEKYSWEISEDGRIATTRYLSDKEINEFDGLKLDYKDVQIECVVSSDAIPDEDITNIAEISEYKYGDTDVTKDVDSESDNMKNKIPDDKDLPNYKKEQKKEEYVPGNEDDDDFEKVYVKEFDLALRKFITEIQGKEIKTREPQVKYQNGKISYEHTKEPVIVHVGDVVIYTLRIYNEGEIQGYASLITDDIPEYLEYLPEEETNIKYKWKLDEQDKNKVVTNYLSKENGETNLLNAFDGVTLDYKDIKIAFKVKDPGSNTYIITNHAQISDDTDENGNEIKDKDSETDKWNEGEDDQDIENIKVEYFDLSLLKFVSKVTVIENDKETISETGYNGHEDPEPVVKVELHKKKLKEVTVKFGYGITITNEGDIPGYATEITDYIPEGLRFETADNPLWADEGNNVISTKQLENTLLQPGESTTVEVILTWINGADNLSLKTNTAEISEDKNEYDVPDRDSIPDNKKDGEDDIDVAKVILAIATGAGKTYLTLTIALLTIILIGVLLIKKFVM